MSKEHLKIVFLVSFIAISIKCLVLGFDISSCIAMGISSGFMFAYDFVASKTDMSEIKEKLDFLKAEQEELKKDMLNIRATTNVQKINTTRVSSNSPFPNRI